MGNFSFIYELTIELLKYISMKNLKIIGCALFIAILYSFATKNSNQTNSSERNEVSLALENNKMSPSISLLVTFDAGTSEADKQRVRNVFFMHNLAILDEMPCSPSQEEWIVQFVSESAFNNILSDVGSIYVYLDGNSLPHTDNRGEGESELQPKGIILRYINFTISYDTSCSF